MIKKIEFKFEGDPWSLTFLSEKFILLQNENNSLSKYQICRESKIKLEFKGIDKYQGWLRGKYGGNSLIFTSGNDGNKGIFIYG